MDSIIVRTRKEQGSDMIIHADDFGITLEQSKDILACSAACGGEGALSSTSAMVTSPAFVESATFAKPFVDAGCIKMGLHLNLVEGQALSSAHDAPLLVAPDGRFRLGFAKMLALSLSGECEALTCQVRHEARAQIRRFLEAFPELVGRLRVDSHQHFHMIPAVFDGLLAAVADEGCTLEYLRVPAEPLGPYLKVPTIRRVVPPVNVVKNVLLNQLWKQVAAKYPADLPAPATFYGLALSGRMQHAADEAFLAGVSEAAQRDGREVELLFHPGGMPSVADCPDPDLKGFCAFYLSPDRAAEAEALRSLPHLAVAHPSLRSRRRAPDPFRTPSARGVSMLACKRPDPLGNGGAACSIDLWSM